MILEHAPALIVLSPLTAGLTIKVMSRFPHSKASRDFIAFFGLLIPILFLFFVSRRSVIIYEMGGWPAPYTITLILDGLSISMALITGIITLSTFVYYVETLDIRKDADDYHFLFLFMTTGLYGVFLTGDLVNRFVFFEITILTTYVLLTFIGTRESLRASYRYLVIGSIASVMFLAGIALVYFHTGHLDLYALSALIPEFPAHTKNIIFIFFLVAVGIKLGIIPFHTWLADTHVHAPTPMTAILAGLTVKTGGYIMLKLFHIGFDTILIRYMVVGLGAFTAIFGAAISLKYFDMKRILAWLTISHMGVIALTLAIWTPESVASSLLYLVNHSFYKALLFLGVGGLAYLYGTSDIRELPIMKSNVLLSSSIFIGLLALAGVPPFNGFYSRWLILDTVQDPVIYSVIVITTILTVSSALRILLLANKSVVGKNKNLTGGMLLPIVILAGLCSFIGLTTSLVGRNLIEPAVVSIFGEPGTVLVPMGIEIQSLISFHGMIIFISIFIGYALFLAVESIHPDWIEGLLSNVSISNSVRYIILILAILLLLNVLF